MIGTKNQGLEDGIERERPTDAQRQARQGRLDGLAEHHARHVRLRRANGGPPRRSTRAPRRAAPPASSADSPAPARGVAGPAAALSIAPNTRCREKLCSIIFSGVFTSK